MLFAIYFYGYFFTGNIEIYYIISYVFLSVYRYRQLFQKIIP